MTTTAERPSTETSPVAGSCHSGGERHWRSIIKGISWRAVGTVDTMMISYLVTGRVKIALSIGFVELFTKVTLFYLHERVWQRIPYGKMSERTE
jgi:uncharacterized membrane protein